VEKSARTGENDFEETRAMTAAIAKAAALVADTDSGAVAVNAALAPVSVWVVTVPAGSMAVFARDCCGWEGRRKIDITRFLGR
jgi:hypothetical protein